MERIIIAGGVAAGMSAASKARRMNPDLQVDVYTDEDYVSYSGCCLPYYTQGLMEDVGDLLVRRPEQLAKQGINLHMRHKVMALHPDSKEITVQTPDGEERRETYDRLVIATGASPIVPDIPGTDLPCVHTVKQIGDVERIRAILRGGKVERAVVVGGGFIGVEMVEALSAYSVETTMLEAAPQILTILDADMAAMVEEHFEAEGISVYKNERVTAIEQRGAGAEVVTESGHFEADMVILAIGVAPNSGFAAVAGIRCGARGAILVDEQMRTSLPEIWAAGDCATARHMLTGEDVYIPLGTTANKQGKLAGENAAGGDAEFAGVLGTSIFKALELEGSRTGLSTREAQARGMDIWETKITADTYVDTYPGSGKMTVKLLMERGSGKLVGGQIVGSRTSAKRIDVIAAFIQMGATVRELAKLDMAYAPPFSDAWDALLVAANAALSKMK